MSQTLYDWTNLDLKKIVFVSFNFVQAKVLACRVQHVLELYTVYRSDADPDPNQVRIHRIHMFLGLLDPDPLVRGIDPDPAPDPSTIKQK